MATSKILYPSDGEFRIGVTTAALSQVTKSRASGSHDGLRYPSNCIAVEGQNLAYCATHLSMREAYKFARKRVFSSGQAIP
jgi:hypothetical protein